MKTRQAIFAAGLLFLTVMAGCGKETTESILEKTRKNVKEVSSVTGDMNADLGVSVGQSGMTMGADLGLTGDWEGVRNPYAFHFDGTLDISFMKLTMDLEMYGVEEDDKMTLYTKFADQWTKTESESDTGDEESNLEGTFKADLERLALGDKTEEVNGKDAYVLQTTLTEKDVKDALKAADEVKAEDMEKLDLSGLKIEVTMKVYKEDKLPAGFSVDLKDGLKNFISSGTGDSEMQVSLDKCVLSANITDYNSIDKIEIPKEALEAEENLIQGLEQGIEDKGGAAEADNQAGAGFADGGAAEEDSNNTAGLDEKNADEPKDAADDAYEGEKPDQAADGSFVLMDYENIPWVTIRTPEGFEEDYMQKAYFSFTKKPQGELNNYISANYRIIGLDDYYTEENYVEDFLAQEKNMGEYGYKALKCTEPEKITMDGREISYMTIGYSSGEGDGENRNYQVNYWTKLDETHILECSVLESVYGADISMEAGLSQAETMFSCVVFPKQA